MGLLTYSAYNLAALIEDSHSLSQNHGEGIIERSTEIQTRRDVVQFITWWNSER